ncbi:SLAP domain-containing protein [Companilactobacillus nodensis]|uniref:S-layer protein C-terminal domain-containing protein n=1 Tax=Companilactobacillus nodensis DSM 19682 = JCM 14932 = NBRC 107160 TaxID=1423775 RepID=A0A0R1KD43_9LACO|nr:SLAP domain-containing protein [Companilactobacillus nodensis]KRK81275.1 hypothetical protein FD03_GL000867 [Companilactobacillus nodensis DSM 19682 = JCM 14932 = NBRC 107160]
MNKKLIGSLAMAGFAAISLSAVSNLTNVSAAGVATTGSSIVRIYNPQGSLVTNRALMPNTPWRVGKTKTINGVSMYQVATSEYVKASEVTYDANAGSSNSSNTSSSTSNRGVVIYANNAVVWDDRTGVVEPQTITGEFQMGKAITDGQYTFYQVSNHGWVEAGGDIVKTNMAPKNLQTDANFVPGNGYVNGMSIKELRDMLIDPYNCDPTILASIPDHNLLLSYGRAVGLKMTNLYYVSTILENDYPGVWTSRNSL